jgi:hypothetical protein
VTHEASDVRLVVAAEPVACLRCGYDLRSLPRDGNCPECGLAVADARPTSDLARAVRFRPLKLAGWLIVVPCVAIVPAIVVFIALGELVNTKWFGWANLVLWASNLALIPLGIVTSSAVMVGRIRGHRISESRSAFALLVGIVAMVAASIALFVMPPTWMALLGGILFLPIVWAIHVLSIAGDMRHRGLRWHAMAAALAAPVLLALVIAYPMWHVFIAFVPMERRHYVDSDELDLCSLAIVATLPLVVLGVHMTRAKPRSIAEGPKGTADSVAARRGNSDG